MSTSGSFDNRLSGSIDYFQRKADGLKASRYDVLIPNEAGFSLPEENLNSDMFKGFDGQITWHDKVRDFNYSIGATFTYSRKYDWHQYLPRFGNSWHEYRSSLNERFANITWGYLSDGQFRSWEEIAGYPVDIDGQGNYHTAPGRYKVQRPQWGRRNKQSGRASDRVCPRVDAQPQFRIEFHS